MNIRMRKKRLMGEADLSSWTLPGTEQIQEHIKRQIEWAIDYTLSDESEQGFWCAFDYGSELIDCDPLQISIGLLVLGDDPPYFRFNLREFIGFMDQHVEEEEYRPRYRTVIEHLRLLADDMEKLVDGAE